MRGSKAKKLRVIAEALGRELPKVVYATGGHKIMYMPDGDHIREILWPVTVTMGSCQRRMYKTMKARLSSSG